MVKRRAHVYISGDVQGVSFRYYTRREAKRLGVKGWVRNLYDGRVEVLLEGEEVYIKRLIEWCRRGPPLARVREVEVDWEDYEGEYKDFDLRYGY